MHFLFMSVRINSPVQNPMNLLGLKCLCHIRKKITYDYMFHIQNEGEERGKKNE